MSNGCFIGGDDVAAFLMIGQSNMAGRGEMGDVEPIDNYRCFMLRNGRYVRMREPVNCDRSMFVGKFKSGISLAASFADEYTKNFEGRVGLIPCADGGTEIDEWVPGDILYDHAVYMTKLAMRTSKFSGFLWHQGECNCLSEADFAGYKEKLVTLINSLRRDLNAYDVPFIMGELSHSYGEENNFEDRPERLNKILYEIAEELPLCAVVSSEGLVMKPDGLHFNSESLREFGKRYLEAYKSLVK